MLLLLLAACSDQALHGKDSPAAFDTSDPGWSGGDSGDTSQELCNGVDDDGDGEIDEGFPDEDGNGRADCIDGSCPSVEAPAAGEIGAVDDACDGSSGGTVSDPWNVVEEWEWPISTLGMISLPVVGNLTDDNGDGRIDDDDTPDIVITDSASTTLGLLSGDGSALHWEVSGYVTDYTPLVADVDGDGRNDIVTFDTQAHVVMLDNEGNEVWTSSEPSTSAYPTATACDLDGDGVPEVIAGDLVVHGTDGSTYGKLAGRIVGTYSTPVCADLDLDGLPEIFLEGTVYDADLDELYSPSVNTIFGTMAAVVQADADPEGELVVVDDSDGVVVDTDGTTLVKFSWVGSLTGPPCVGDLDGDGQSEVAVPSNKTLLAYELDGTQMWSYTTGDDSGFAGCSTWDVDGDGAAEVLFAGEHKFRIFDGATGTVHFETDHNSWTVFEYPVIADVDHDGSAEILTAENLYAPGSGFTGLRAWGQAAGTWPRTSATYGLHDFAETNQSTDGTLPADPAPSWSTYGVFRGRAHDVAGVALPDLRVSLVDACTADCDYGPIQVTVQVENAGGGDADAGATLTLYAVDDAGEHAVYTEALPEIAAGTRLEAETIPVAVADRGDGRWRVVVDGGSAVSECDADNDDASWDLIVCPG